ncbi:hypothetical protein D3C78_1755080 [compost metagenome]
MYLRPEQIQARDVAQIGHFPSMFKTVEKIGEVGSVVQQTGIRWRRKSGVDCGGASKPVGAHEALNGREIGEQCINCTFENGIAVNRKARLSGKRHHLG